MAYSIAHLRKLRSRIAWVLLGSVVAWLAFGAFAGFGLAVGKPANISNTAFAWLVGIAMWGFLFANIAGLFSLIALPIVGVITWWRSRGEDSAASSDP